MHIFEESRVQGTNQQPNLKLGENIETEVVN